MVLSSKLAASVNVAEAFSETNSAVNGRFLNDKNLMSLRLVDKPRFHFQ